MIQSGTCANGHEVQDGDNFCSTCGSPPVDAEAVEPPRAVDTSKCENGHAMGHEGNYCQSCGAQRAGSTAAVIGAAGAAGTATALSGDSVKEGKPRWVVPAIAGGVAAVLILVAVLVFTGGSTPAGAKSAKLVDQISGTTCADAASSLAIHRGSIAVVQGQGRKALALGKVSSVWNGTSKDGKSVCNVLIETNVPQGQKSYRIVVGKATPLIVSSEVIAAAVVGYAWVSWSGTSWVEVQ